MEAIYQYAWLIPVLPLVGAMLVGLGLISANQATNRLRKLNAVAIVLPEFVWFFHARSGGQPKYHPDLYFLGISGDVFVPTSWVLVRSQGSSRCLSKSICRQPCG